MAQRRIVIKNGRIFDGAGFFYADLLLEGGRIAGIGEYGASDAYDPDHIFDASGMTVTAGLVDIHTHIWAVSPDEFGTSAEGTCFAHGVTACVDGGAVKGSRALLDSFGISSAVFVSVSIRDNRVSFDLTQRLLDAYGERAIGVKVYFDTSSGQVRDISPLRAVCTFARERGLKVMVHCSHSPVPMKDIVEELSSGDILTHIYHGAENNCTENEYAALKRAREKGVVLDVGMAGHVHTDFSILARAAADGMYPDTISTDVTNLSAFVRGGIYGLTLCMSIMRDAGMSEREILLAVTERAAAAVGKTGEWGRLAVGARADVAVLEWTDTPYSFCQDPSNTICGSHSYRCFLTVCNGRVVYRA